MSDDATPTETVRLRASAFQQIVEDCLSGRLPAWRTQLLEKLREAGASVAEATEYVAQARDRFAAHGVNAPPSGALPTSQSREPTPEGLEGEELEDFRKQREASLSALQKQREEERLKAADDVAWAVLRAKLGQILPAAQASRAPLSSGDLAQLFGLQLASPSTIPAAVLAAAPHLSALSANVKSDVHLEETWKLRQAFGTDKALDPIINVMQSQELVDPIPRSIWRSIIQDHYVDFEKLFATMAFGYDHEDEPKDFAGGFSLVKKDQVISKRPIKTESDWMRVFTAWRMGVSLLYPHRTTELAGYLQMVIELFRAAPTDPLVAIQFDVESRDRYAKSPYHMDDRSQLNLSLLSQMFRAPTSTSSKRSSTSSSISPNSPKRAAIPCQNWNMGACTEPCGNRRLHGTCCECGKPHRAKDHEECLSLLQARRRKGASGNFAEGSNSSNRA